LHKLYILFIIVFVLLLGYAVHKVIKRFIDPRKSVNHLFLYFLFHFIAVFILVFLVDFFILKFSATLFG